MPSDQTTNLRQPIIGATYCASVLMSPGCCALALHRAPVWMGSLDDVPRGISFDHITMHPDDIAEMEEAARAR